MAVATEIYLHKTYSSIDFQACKLVSVIGNCPAKFYLLSDQRFYNRTCDRPIQVGQISNVHKLILNTPNFINETKAIYTTLYKQYTRNIHDKYKSSSYNMVEIKVMYNNHNLRKCSRTCRFILSFRCIAVQIIIFKPKYIMLISKRP